MCSVEPCRRQKTFKNVFGRAMRTAKKPSKMCSVGPCGRLKTIQKCVRSGHADGKKTFKNVFCRAMRTATKPSKMCSVGPCGRQKPSYVSFRFVSFVSFRSFRFVLFVLFVCSFAHLKGQVSSALHLGPIRDPYGIRADSGSIRDPFGADLGSITPMCKKRL